MTLELPARTLVIPDFFIEFWWVWFIATIVSYLLWNLGKKGIQQEGSFFKKIGAYTGFSIGWLASLLFLIAFLFSGLINLLRFWGYS